MKLKNIPKTDIEYVEFYARKLKQDSKFFKQQKELIDSQLTSHSDLTKSRFPKKDFKNKVRAYLREIGILK